MTDDFDQEGKPGYGFMGEADMPPEAGIKVPRKGMTAKEMEQEAAREKAAWTGRGPEPPEPKQEGEKTEVDDATLLRADYVLNDTNDEKERYRTLVRDKAINVLWTGMLEIAQDTGDRTGMDMAEEIIKDIRRDGEGSLFVMVQEKLGEFAEQDPSLDNPRIIKVFKDTRDEIIDEADKIDVLKGVHKMLDDAQKLDYQSARTRIAEIYESDLDTLARQVERLNKAHWDYAGMVPACIEGALDYMDLGMAKAQLREKQGDQAALEKEKDKLERKIKFTAWGTPRDFRGAALEYIRRKKKEEETQAQQQQGIDDEAKEELRRTRRAAERQAKLQQEQYELMLEGFDDVVRAADERNYVNAEQYKQRPPYWLRRLGKDERLMVINVLYASSMASLKKESGMMSLDEGFNYSRYRLRMERTYLARMMDMGRSGNGLPGYRVALATMNRELFRQGENHFILRGEKKGYVNPDGTRDDETTESYEIMGDMRKWGEYKEGLVDRVHAYLEEESGLDLDGYCRAHGDVSVRELAVLAVATADNHYFATGAYDSADEKRGLQSGATDLYGEQLRALFQPGLRGRAKWYDRDFNEGETDIAWGVLGDWIGDNIAAGRGDFYDGVQRQRINMIPNRLWFSVWDHVPFSQGPHKDKKSLAEVMLEADGKEEVATSAGAVYDFKEGYFDVNDVMPDELWGFYADGMGAAIDFYKHLVSENSQQDRLSSKRLADKRAKLLREVKEPCFVEGGRRVSYMKKILTDPDVMTAAIGLAASPTGFEMGVPNAEIVLRLPEEGYDFAVTSALTREPRLYSGMPSSFRKDLFRKFNSKDMGSLGGTLKEMLTPGIVNRRKGLRLKATENLASGR